MGKDKINIEEMMGIKRGEDKITVQRAALNEGTTKEIIAEKYDLGLNIWFSQNQRTSISLENCDILAFKELVNLF